MKPGDTVTYQSIGRHYDNQYRDYRHKTVSGEVLSIKGKVASVKIKNGVLIIPVKMLEKSL